MSTAEPQSHNTLYIGNLDGNVTENDLYSFFGSCGEIDALKLAGDQTRSTRFAFISFVDPMAVQRALALSGSTLVPYTGSSSPVPRPIRVTYSKNPINPAHSVRQPPPQPGYYNPAHSYGGYGAYGAYPPQYMPPYGYPAPPAHHGYPPAPPGRENYDALSRTIYVSGIDQMLTEDQLRQFFSCCGAVTAVRLCGDSSRTARFAFVEFDTREAAVAAIGLSSTTLGNHQIRVSPSKTAIQKRPAPLPSSPEVLERVSRTIHVGNLDISVTEQDLREYFSSCGDIKNLVLAGDSGHDTRFAFIEYTNATCAQRAMSLSATRLGKNAIRVSASKTPIYAPPRDDELFPQDDLGQKRKRDDEDPSDPKRRRTEEELDESPHVSHLKSSTRSDDGGGAL